MTRPIYVVGGGLVGCMTAYYLQLLGKSVCLLERDRLGAGASSGNCGYICPSHIMPMAFPGAVRKTLMTMCRADSPVAITKPFDIGLLRWLIAFAWQCRKNPMNRASAARHELLACSKQLYLELMNQEAIDCDWRENGLLIVHKEQESFANFQITADWLRDTFGLAVEGHPGDAVVELEPTLRRGLAGGWYFPNDAQVMPTKVVASLRQILLERGVQIEEGVEVEDLEIRKGRMDALITNRGDRSASAAVICTGAEAPNFARRLGCRIPIQPGKGYSLTIPTEEALPRIPMIFESHHVGITAFKGALRVGSTMEFAGYDRSFNERRLALLMKSAREHLAEPPDARVSERWCGWRPMVYDGLPCIDHAPAASNVILAAGNGMIGLASAPATGKVAAAIATGTHPPIDPNPYTLRRFGWLF
ncbi:MAG: FAD-dependent oxidoreductase [Planctomycetota bacterium]